MKLKPGGSNRSIVWWIVLVPALALYCFAFVLPLENLFVESIKGNDGEISLHNYQAFFTDGVSLGIFLRSFRLASLITLLCAVMGYPVALFMRRAGPTLRIIGLTIVISPLLSSVIVRNVAWLLVLGREGFVNETLRSLGLISAPLPLLYNTFGVVVGVTHVYMAFFVLPVFNSLIAIDQSLENAARSLGASPFTTFWRVTFPLSLPGVIGGATLVFVLSMGVYLTPVIMGGSFVTTLAMVITDLVRSQFDWARAASFSVILLIFIGFILLTASLVEKKIERMRGDEA